MIGTRTSSSYTPHVDVDPADRPLILVAPRWEEAKPYLSETLSPNEEIASVFVDAILAAGVLAEIFRAGVNAVARGEVDVVIGPLGSGKSTMCRTSNRLETIDSGEILIEGQPLPQEGTDLARMRAELGMVFQQFNLFAHMTVLQNVMLGPVDVLGVSKDEARERAMDLLGRVGVAEQADKVPAQLSGGQQQRVAIARSLAMQPKAMLFDEPTSALDPEMINEVLEVMVRLAQQGMTMIVITHEMNFARRVADRVVFMADGQIVETGTPDEFFDHPQTKRAQDFLNSIKGH